MSQSGTFEGRVAALLQALADEMPADVDAVAMTRLVATRRERPNFLGLSLLRFDARLGLVLVVLALSTALVAGALVAGWSSRLDEEHLLRGPVAPFIGLPPPGARPSDPASGELVVRFAARMPALGYEMQQAFLYADGRLIWQRNLEGSTSAQRIFGDLEPTRAIIEQRLTPEGVALVMGDMLAAVSADPGASGPPGTWAWAENVLRIDGRLQAVSWVDSRATARLADPGSWLPATAWADRTLRGYVPWRYAVCLGAAVPLSSLPPGVAERLAGRLGWAGPGSPSSIGTCYEVTTEVAREIAAALDAAAIGRVWVDLQLAYRVTPDDDGGVYFAEFLPHGELLLRGG